MIVFGTTFVADSEPNLTGGETIVSNTDIGSVYLKSGYGTSNIGTLNPNATQTGSSEFNLNGIAFSLVIIPNNASALLNFI